MTRKRRNDKALYFGPYDSATAIRNTLRLINRHFYLRTCPDTEFHNRSRPCLEYQIHRCPGPCVLPVSRATYDEHIQDVVLFLSGRADELLTGLNAKMRSASERTEFELAAHYRDQIKAVERSLTRQNVVLERGIDIDVFGLYREGDAVVMQHVAVRGGYVTGSRAYPLGRHELPDTELVAGFIERYYDRDIPIPDQILTPTELPEREALADWLSDRRGKRIGVHWPQRGAKVRLIEMANRNAEQSFTVSRKKEEETLHTLTRLQRRLGLRNFPSRIECYDISNTQGGEPVASQVCFIDGEPAKAEYRHYKMRAPEEPNDFLMMHETITRRFRKAIETGEFPSLVVIDGGKGQLNAAREAMRELEIVDVDIVSLAKARLLDGETRSSAPAYSPERVFVPGAKNALVLRQNSAELYLLTRLRDEAHRFAITYHRKLRGKRTLRSQLDGIAGVGPTRKSALIGKFGSVKRIREASVEEIAAVNGIGPQLAEHILAELNGRSAG